MTAELLRMIAGWLGPIFVFGILVFIHEFGHFVFAKKNGVRVERFSFGFGKKLWSRQIGDTEYLICLIPLGGYIKMAGDEPGKQKEEPDEYLSKSPGQRAQISKNPSGAKAASHVQGPVVPIIRSSLRIS